MSFFRNRSVNLTCCTANCFTFLPNDCCMHLCNSGLIRRLWLFILLFPLSFLVNAQEIPVSGRVLSTEGDKPLAGVSVQVRGSQSGISTDENGNFRLNAR